MRKTKKRYNKNKNRYSRKKIRKMYGGDKPRPLMSLESQSLFNAISRAIGSRPKGSKPGTNPIQIDEKSSPYYLFYVKKGTPDFDEKLKESKDKMINDIIKIKNTNNENKSWLKKYTDKDYNDLLNEIEKIYKSISIETGFEASLIIDKYTDHLNNNIVKNEEVCTNLSKYIPGTSQFGKIKTPKINPVPVAPINPVKPKVETVAPKVETVKPINPFPVKPKVETVAPKVETVAQVKPKVEPVAPKVEPIKPAQVIGGSYDNPIPIQTTSNVFLDKDKTLWLQDKIGKGYTVTDVDRDGNCFFAALREAYKTIGVTMTVKDLRQIVYNNFEEWKKKHPEEVKDQLALQEDIKLELEKLEKIDDADETTKKHYFYGEVLPSIKRWCAEPSSKDFKYCKDFNDRYQLGDINDKSLKDKKGKDVKISYFKYNFVEQNKNPSAKDEKEIKLKTDFVDKFYKIATDKIYRDQRKKELEAQDRDNKFLIPLKADDIMLREHWAGQMDIDILKDKLNIDLIIISEDYNNNDIRFTCDINVTTNVKSDYYIMLYYTGGHYELISFNNRSIFKYNDMPADIIAKCISK